MIADQWKARFARAGKAVDGRDALMLIGCALVWYGLNVICAGLGPAIVGAYLLLIVTLGR